MKPRHALLFAALLLLLGANWALRVDPARRNVELLPNMVHAVSVQSFSGEMRAPVPGTVLYHSTPLHYTATKADAVRAGLELTNPFARDPQALVRGATVYANFCLPCHGVAGRGDGIVAQRGFPTPPSLLAPNARQIADGQIFHILTWGQNNMPSYASQIDQDDRWRAVAYVRSLQKKEAK